MKMDLLRHTVKQRDYQNAVMTVGFRKIGESVDWLNNYQLLNQA
jgi:hypothetical protein